MPLKVLIVEDSEDDTILLVKELEKSFDVSYERVDTAKGIASALKEKKWDIIISDYSMPRFSGLGALKVLKESGLDLPFIIVSGKIGEETAVEAMNAGVHDYILKDNMARLIPAVKKELEEAKGRAKHREADRKLREYKKHLENLVKIRTSELAETNVSLKNELSERKKAEQELSKQKKRYEELYQNAPDGYLSADASRNIAEVNNTFLNMAGYPRDEVIGKSILNFFEGDIPFGKSFIKNLGLGLRKKDNEILPVSVNAFAIFSEGNFSGSSLAVRDISEVKKLEKENTSLAKDVIKLTKKIPLTENERMVLYSLVKYPLLNDIELSRKLNLKRSTITSIRNRLSRETFFFPCRIPNFSLIGCELMTIISAKTNPLYEVKNMPKDICDAPEQVYLDATSNELAGACMSKNMTELKRHLDSFILRCEKNSIAGNFRIAYLPFEMSRIERLFDCSMYLKKILELNIKEEAEKPVIPVKRNLTPNEKVILYALVKFPEYNDSEISEITGLPRPSISQTRARLSADGFLITLNIPNLVKVGSEIMVLEHLMLEHEASAEMMDDVINHLNETANCCSLIALGNELFSLNIYGDYTEYEEVKNRGARFYDKHRLRVLNSSIHPILGVGFFKMQFAPLIYKIFGLKVNF